MPLAMQGVFRATTRRYGPERGYQAGFAVYWASCWFAAGTVLGPRRLLRLWLAPAPALPPPRALGAAVLTAPPLGGFATQWLPQARESGPAVVAFAAGIGTTNALAEEVFWRGVPLAVFPDEALRGWLWPSLGFIVWHLVPLTARPSSLRRRAAVLAGAALVGSGYGWIALRTRSLAWVAPAHALTDSSGLAPIRSAWLGRPALSDPERGAGGGVARPRLGQASTGSRDASQALKPPRRSETSSKPRLRRKAAPTLERQPPAQ